MAAPIFQDSPWLGEEHGEYQGVPFDQYLELYEVRRSPEKRPRIVRDSRARHSIRKVAKLQYLFTFGLLEAVMQVKIPGNKLLRLDSSGEQVVTSEYLPDLLLDFQNRVRKLQGDDRTRIPDACREWARRIDATFSHASNVVVTELDKGRWSWFWLAGLHEPQAMVDIIIQMGSVAEALAISTMAAFYPEVRPRRPLGTGVMYLLNLFPYQIRTTMLARGWCPVIVDTIAFDRPSVLGYARSLEGPRCRRSEGHGECTPTSCEVNTRDSGKLPPKHVSEPCKCNNSMPSLKFVKRFLQDRKIPVVKYRPPPDDVLSVEDSSNTPYVAISHVWGDGLRGTAEKGLPACQVKRLAELTSSIPGVDCGGAFWIDTICIPEIPDMRHRAIGLMAKTYKEAQAVLVIDAGIREISSSAPVEEKLFHVYSSRWMQRLWTFQEAALAKKLYFEFSDARLVSLDELRLSERSFTEKELINPVLISLVQDVKTAMWGLADVKGDGFDFADLLHILRRRNTSDKGDETLAVCGILNLDAIELAKISDSEERMAIFLLRIKKLPSDIIFVAGVSRLDKPGFRWAPKTFMGGDVTGFESGQRDGALCTPTGLEAEYDAITQGVVIGGEKEEWCISHLHEGRMSMYIVRRIPISVNAPYCNTILLDGGLPASNELNPRACVGAWVDPEPVAGGSDGDRILCEFRTTLSLKLVNHHLSELEKSYTVMTVKSVRRMRVKVV